MTDTTTFLDLDSVVPEREVVVKLGGIEHKLVSITTEDFVANTIAMRDFAAKDKVDIEDELALVHGMLMRAFPTMTKEILNKLSMLQLNKLNQFAQENNGQRKVEDAAASENPPTAGQ